jgi:hypothetical protein
MGDRERSIAASLEYQKATPSRRDACRLVWTPAGTASARRHPQPSLQDRASPSLRLAARGLCFYLTNNGWCRSSSGLVLIADRALLYYLLDSISGLSGQSDSMTSIPDLSQSGLLRHDAVVRRRCFPPSTSPRDASIRTACWLDHQEDFTQGLWNRRESSQGRRTWALHRCDVELSDCRGEDLQHHGDDSHPEYPCDEVASYRHCRGPAGCGRLHQPGTLRQHHTLDAAPRPHGGFA